MSNFLKYGLLAITSATIFGCAQGSLGGNTYSRDDARRAHEVRNATVSSVRMVRLEGNVGNTSYGGITGAVVGGVIGAGLGGGKNRNLAALGGVVAGGVAGSHLERYMNESSGLNGLEIIVRTDDGRSMAVIQERDAIHFVAGDRVNLIGSGNNLRVTR